MDHLPYGTPPRWWAPKLSPFWISAIRPFRVMRARLREGLYRVDVQGLERLRSARNQGAAVLITPNHAGHADAYILLAASDRLAWPFYYLVGWQVFQGFGLPGRWVLTQHGCFSIDREGHDVRAFRQAVEVVAHRPHPLVIFAEGEVYHNNEWVAPFRPGAAAIALSAAQKTRRPVVCVPAAIRYRYLEDPTPRLLWLMEALERKIHVGPRPGLPLAARVFCFAQDLLAQKELAHLGRLQSGTFPDRLASLTEAILGRLEERYKVAAPGPDVPARVTLLRQQAIKSLEGLAPADPRRQQAGKDLDDLALAVQLFSYAKDYATERPTLEHLAEVLDKFEEDVLGAPTATVRAARRATILFGQPVPVQRRQGKKPEVRILTETLQQQVQTLLDDLNGVAIPREADRLWLPPSLVTR